MTAAQQRIGRLGNHAALTSTQPRMIAKKPRQHDIGWTSKAKYLSQCFFSAGDDRGWQSHDLLSEKNAWLSGRVGYC
jgi:hypothetical protein